ncbi:diacylglycerol/lipid kinase family protein [Heliorestis convoluta]|uniref:Lipid kinase, YegS/Rv2252/BmrU family protein n=1 Tax=Heliorestis convoluta TaxID=356322 RepID=A0A5Q2N2P4_9FIRM|nr:YegS/Rv2252/BmrU family lipid kinase [Heliorestis convoluta]QGG47552.1 lipid kinase, YegS/Rv2252/BmrU family protein [Heliorestis convoluta]
MQYQARKRLKLIYNPEAGSAAFRTRLDLAVRILQSGGWQVLTYRTEGKAELTVAEAHHAIDEGCSAVVAVGGDGTLHQVMNGLVSLVEEGRPLPTLGIIPAGTANDLASYLSIPKDVETCCDIIVKGKKKKIDIGALAGRYFLNVASGGLLTDVSHKVDQALKQELGKFAYYLKALEQLPEFRPFPLQVQLPSGEKIYEGDTLLFLVLNSAGAGSFSQLAPQAQIDDALLDLVVFRSCSISEFVGLFLSVLQGDHVRSPLVKYHQAQRYLLQGPESMETDLDGEIGPPLPWDIGVLPRALQVFVPEQNGKKRLRLRSKG